MISRQLENTLIKRLGQTPAVALLGSRQVGKTTLARALDPGKPMQYLDLERPSDLARLADPELYLSGFADHLVKPRCNGGKISSPATSSAICRNKASRPCPSFCAASAACWPTNREPPSI